MSQTEIAAIAPKRPEVVGAGKTIKSFAPPLALKILAELTPPDINTSVIDEAVDPIDFSKRYDLVAISVATHTAIRAYQIADGFRARGIPVVLGGIHPTALPEEAAKHADAVVLGEAELSWPKVLADLQGGRELQPFYQNKERPILTNFTTTPRRDLFTRSAYLIPDSCQTTRGCPNACIFCSVTSFYGRSYRSRPVEQVLKEVDILPGKLVFFVDDNIAAEPERAKQLFQGVAKRNKLWIGQASVTIADDEEVLAAAAASGCLALFLGIETLEPANLRAMGKQCNVVEKYEEAIKRIHSHGIAIFGAFIFGLDHDTEDIFETTVKFARRTRLEGAQFNILTPYPGTPLRRLLEREGRIRIKDDWSLYHADKAVIEPKNMSAGRLEEGRNWAEREFFSLSSIRERIGLGHRHFLAMMALNLNYRSDFISQLLLKGALPLTKKLL